MFPKLLIAFFAACLLGACAGPPKIVPIAEVVQHAREGASTDHQLARLRGAKTSYALRGSDFAKLARQGVAPQVLDELQQRFVNDVDMLTRFMALGESYGGCQWCYPQPVDLNRLDAGGSGMLDSPRLGRMESFSRPQGVPNWVPASPKGSRAYRVAVSDVMDWTRSGLSQDETLRRVQAGRFAAAYGERPGGLGAISTHWAAGLKGSELALLGQQGASDATLDALQGIFLAEYIESARQHYQNWGKGFKP